MLHFFFAQTEFYLVKRPEIIYNLKQSRVVNNDKSRLRKSVFSLHALCSIKKKEIFFLLKTVHQ